MKTTQMNPENTEVTTVENPIPKKPFLPMTKIIDYLKPDEPISMKGAIWTVMGLHLVVVASIFALSSNSSAQAKQIEEDKKYVLANAPMVGVETPPNAEPASPPAAKPVSDSSNTKPKPKVVKMIPKNPNPNYPAMTRDYVVKKGDTFTSIVKRYGLDRTRLKKINGLKDENKLLVGQKLKFIE